LATCATAAPPLALTLAVCEAPTASWQLASCVMTPWLSAAPTPSPRTDARAILKSFAEPVAVVAEFATSTLRQTWLAVPLQSGSRMPVWIGCSGPLLDWPGVLSTPDSSLPNSDRIVMCPW
jgi:hypothetical protein